MDELVLARFKAHADFIINRIHEKDKQKQFAMAYESIVVNEGHDPFFDYNTLGAKMALDIYKQIMQIHDERFVEGRTGDAYLERI